MVAEKLTVLGAPPGRVAHHYLAAGQPSRAVPFVIRAVETAGALGAYRDALTLVDAVRAHADAEQLPALLARRGDLLMALGDPAAVSAYREAVAVTTGTEHRLVRARLARASSLAGDLDTARSALAGLGLDGDAADAPILLAQGNLAYFSGDMDAAWDIASQARDRLHAGEDPWQIIDLVVLQGLIAHQRGEWSERFRLELRRTEGKQALVTTVFDAHLCVAEYLLYGPVPYAEVIRETEDLRRRATQAGALRGVAFATALIGEAALLMGDFDRAERELLEALDLHRDSDAPAGEAHALQRLAELRLAQGDRLEAQRLLQRALPLARWSVVSRHLLHRVYGTMIEAAPDPVAARAVVDRAEATVGENDRCTFCVGDARRACGHRLRRGGRHRRRPPPPRRGGGLGGPVGARCLAGRHPGGAGSRGASRRPARRVRVAAPRRGAPVQRRGPCPRCRPVCTEGRGAERNSAWLGLRVPPDVLDDAPLDGVEVGCVRKVHLAVQRQESGRRQTRGELLAPAEPDQPVGAVVQHQGRHLDLRQQRADVLDVDLLEVRRRDLR